MQLLGPTLPFVDPPSHGATPSFGGGRLKYSAKAWLSPAARPAQGQAAGDSGQGGRSAGLPATAILMVAARLQSWRCPSLSLSGPPRSARICSRMSRNRRAAQVRPSVTSGAKRRLPFDTALRLLRGAGNERRYSFNVLPVRLQCSGLFLLFFIASLAVRYSHPALNRAMAARDVTGALGAKDAHCNDRFWLRRARVGGVSRGFRTYGRLH
jgi:hypothetical protein